MMTPLWGKVRISLFRPLSLWLLWGVWEQAVQVINWLYWKLRMTNDDGDGDGGDDDDVLMIFGD